MDTLKNKNFKQYDYLSRYNSTPYYFDTKAKRYIYGIGNQILHTTNFIVHKVKSTDTLDSLALKYYNNPTFWWVIAYYNNILDSLNPLKGVKSIKIPNIASIQFKNERS